MSNLRPCTYCNRRSGDHCYIEGGCVVPPSARKDSALQQGYFQKGPITPPPRWLRILGIGLVLAMLVLAALQAGCAQVRVYERDGVTYHENDLSPCERGASACTMGKNIYYSDLDPGVLAHEEQHARQHMTHGQWKVVGSEVCARVVSQGTSTLVAGTFICRRADGSFVQRSAI